MNSCTDSELFHPPYPTPTPTPTPSTKRKLDELIDDSFPLTRMRKDQFTPSSSSAPPRGQVQFFVRVFSGKTLVLLFDQNDTVFDVHDRILSITGIPIIEQRLIYNGKQLQLEKTLAECRLVNDANLQLVGRMRSTGHPQAWQLLVDMVGLVFSLCQSGPNSSYNSSYGMECESNNSLINTLISKFLSMTRQHSDREQSVGHLGIFLTSLAPLALVTLYRSSFSGNRAIAEEAVKHFVNSSRNTLTKGAYVLCAPIVLEFCKLLSNGVGTGDGLYVFCRSTLGGMVGENGSGDQGFGRVEVKDLINVRELFQFVSELAGKLSNGLVASMGSELLAGVSSVDVGDFSSFLYGVRNGINPKLLARSRAKFPVPNGDNSECYSDIRYGEQIGFLHGVFKDLLGKMETCLEKLEGRLAVMEKENLVQFSFKWNQYLAILKELNSVATMFEGAEELFWGTLKQREVSLCYLIVNSAKRTDDHKWILAHKEVTNFEARRHLVMMMFPDVKDEYDELHEMLIDRLQLLAESFAYIGRAEPESLHGGIFMEFKNEEATGPGVLREWFFLVCQEIFNPQNALFVSCPNDRRRFFPNPASKVDPLHLEYFSFSGRVIALALMHKIQVGIVFDRVFFVQLAGKNVSLEDICDADPYLYNSCRKILELDAEVVDQDALGLTFVREVNELGTRKVVELCAGGKNISVTSKNRKEYVNLLIQHSFVTSIADQMAHFTKGFADIMNSADTKNRALLQKSFFESINLEDFDWMLHGSESVISVEDWKAHTEYDGFKETDPQICWFWKIVAKMSPEQRKVLLFFWTSIKYLPVEGFRGCASLHIPLRKSCKIVCV
ncbi:hypothetical protein Leryth_022836 [Lithospermum erythrorhizon]|nr:hypothetical protein Leryth_022836 [Lithospermum erythrorhizon]